EHMKLSELTPQMLDRIAEMCNISAGHAAGALAQMMSGQIIRLEVPRVSVLKLGELPRGVKGDVGGVLFGIDGPHQGSIVILFDRSSAHALTALLLKKPVDEVDLDDTMSVSTLSEVGNILSSTFLGVLGQLTGWRLLPSVPRSAFESLKDILHSLRGHFGEK